MGQAERDAYIAKTFKVWTEEELLFAFSAGLFKAASSTTIVVENDNISARSLAISVVNGNVGNLEAKPSLTSSPLLAKTVVGRHPTHRARGRRTAGRGLLRRRR